MIFRKYLSTRNLLIATFLMTIGGLVYVLWITTRIVVLYPMSITPYYIQYETTDRTIHYKTILKDITDCATVLKV